METPEAVTKEKGWIPALGTWTKVGLVVLGVVLTVFGHIFVREWYQADVRYQPAEFYRSAGQAITALRVENLGRVAARDVEIAVGFASELRDFSLGAPGTSVEVLSGGVGSETIRLRVERLVPGQGVVLYFTLADATPAGSDVPTDYVLGVYHDEGTGQEGFPTRGTHLLILLYSLTLSVIVGLSVGTYIFKQADRVVDQAFEMVEKGQERSQELVERSAELTNTVGKFLAQAKEDHRTMEEVVGVLRDLAARKDPAAVELAHALRRRIAPEDEPAEDAPQDPATDE